MTPLEPVRLPLFRLISAFSTARLMFSGRGDGGLHDHFADKLFLPIRVIFALPARGALSPILRALLVFRRRTLNPKP